MRKFKRERTCAPVHVSVRTPLERKREREIPTDSDVSVRDVELAVHVIISKIHFDITLIRPVVYLVIQDGGVLTTHSLRFG